MSETVKGIIVLLSIAYLLIWGISSIIFYTIETIKWLKQRRKK